MLKLAARRVLAVGHQGGQHAARPEPFKERHRVVAQPDKGPVKLRVATDQVGDQAGLRLDAERGQCPRERGGDGDPAAVPVLAQLVPFGQPVADRDADGRDDGFHPWHELGDEDRVVNVDQAGSRKRHAVTPA